MVIKIDRLEVMQRASQCVAQLAADPAKKNHVLQEFKALSDNYRIASKDLNSRAVSVHRKNDLLQRLQGSLEKIQVKLERQHEKQSETLTRQAKDIRLLQRELSRLSPKELHTKLKQLDLKVSETIYLYVWIASRCPREPHFSYTHLEEDLSILHQIFVPLLQGDVSGTLLEQIALDFERRAAIEKEKEAANNTAFSAVERDQHRVNGEDLKQDWELQKLLAFQARENEITTFTHRQLKALYHTMPKSVQDVLPKPPYYGRGINFQLYKTLGAHYDPVNGKTTFRVYAPNAQEVVLHLTAYEKTEHRIPLFKGADGIWTAETDHAHPGRTYHYQVKGKNQNEPVKKVDPFAFGNFIHCDTPGKDNHESIVRDIKTPFAWTDGEWMKTRTATDPAKKPMFIYELHSPTWMKKENGDLYNWRELAHKLGKYCNDLNYTHVELMAVFEHTQMISMGYQISNYFCINSRMGTLEDFKAFVDIMHSYKIGVFVDWVPAHFAIDSFSLTNFDGTPLFENDNPHYAKHPAWGTYEFDCSKQFTRDFLASNAEFVLKECHVDGLRVDAVEAMLYMSHGRKNRKGHEINLDSKEFFRNLNTYIRKNYPGVLLMAEEAKGYPCLTRPAGEKGLPGPFGERIGGLGFHLAWHMGFMNALFRKYAKFNPSERSQNYDTLVHTLKGVDGSRDTRPRGYMVRPLSHDECATGQMTLQGRMHGLEADRFAQGRLFLAYESCLGGGPVLDFSGNAELLQDHEWHGRVVESLEKSNEIWLKGNPPLLQKQKTSMQWEQLDPVINPHYYHLPRGAMESRKTLNHLCLHNPAFWDQTDTGFSVIDATDSYNNVISFHRRSGAHQVACVFNFSDHDVKEYCLKIQDDLSGLKEVKEIYNTDNIRFAGGGRTNSRVDVIRDGSGRPTHFKFHLAPYAAIVLEEVF